MKKIIYLSFELLLLNASEIYGTDAPPSSYTNQEKLQILEQIQKLKLFSPGSSRDNVIESLKFTLREQFPWTSKDEMDLRELLNTDGVQLRMPEILNVVRSKSTETESPSWISPEEEERLTREMLVREEQERTDAEIARQWQAEEMSRAHSSADQNRVANGNIVRNLLPPAPAALAPRLTAILEKINAIVRANGLDFDVHAFDSVFGNGANAFNISAPDCQTVIEYLCASIPTERVMSLDQIYACMLQCLNDCAPEFRAKHDLSKIYLDDAFRVLRTTSPHTNLINLFRQVCTIINNYAPSMMQDILASFLSNVNRFKGGKCYQGFRNRMLSTICIIYGRTHLGMFKELFEES